MREQRHTPYRQRVEAAVQSISESAQSAIEDLVYRNPLTDLHNGMYLESVFALTLPEQPVAVAFLEVDGFKNLNSLHGHGVGDDVLRAIGAELAAAAQSGRSSPQGAMVGAFHLSGDEFVLVLSGLDQPSALRVAATAADAAERGASEAIDDSQDAPNVTMTVAVAFADSTHGLRSALQRADELCELAKLLKLEAGPARRVWTDAEVDPDRLAAFRATRDSAQRRRFWCPACGFNGYANLPPTDTCPHCQSARTALAQLAPSSS